MFCHKCGKEIDDDAVVCVHCGVETKNLSNKNGDSNIVVNNQISNTNKIKRSGNNALLDLILIFLTGGLWIWWMIIRAIIRR